MNETGELGELLPINRELHRPRYYGHSPNAYRVLAGEYYISEWKIIATNLLVYGTLALMLQGTVRLLFSRILGRRDVDQTSA